MRTLFDAYRPTSAEALRDARDNRKGMARQSTKQSAQERKAARQRVQKVA